MGAKGSPSAEFSVVLEGLDLDPELESRVRHAIQSAVLKEIATVDLKVATWCRC